MYQTAHQTLFTSSQTPSVQSWNYDLPTLTIFLNTLASIFCFFFVCFLVSSTQLQNMEIRGSFYILCVFLICRFDATLIIVSLFKNNRIFPESTTWNLYLVWIIKLLLFRPLLSCLAFYGFHTWIWYGDSPLNVAWNLRLLPNVYKD